MSDLQHAQQQQKRCSATPHTPKGVVVQHLARITCRTLAALQVQQVQQSGT
jgi:hypothetical protein